MLNVDDYIYKKIEHFFVFLFVCFGFFLGGGEVWVDKKGNNKPFIILTESKGHVSYCHYFVSVRL